MCTLWTAGEVPVYILDKTVADSKGQQFCKLERIKIDCIVTGYWNSMTIFHSCLFVLKKYKVFFTNGYVRLRLKIKEIAAPSS